MTTVLSVVFSGWHPHHLGQTGHLHQGVVLPQQSGLQRSSFSSQLVRRSHNLEQVTARGSWRPNSRMFKRFYYRTQAQATTTVTSLVTLFIYFWAKINILISHTWSLLIYIVLLGASHILSTVCVFEYVSKHNVCHVNIIRSLFGQRNKEYWVVFSSDSVSQKRSYRFGNLTD